MTSRWRICLCLLLAACDGVGRAVVQPGADGDADNQTCEPMQCRAAKFRPLVIPEPLGPDPTCVPPSPEQCEPATETEPGLDHGEPGVCSRTLSLDDDRIDLDALRSLACGHVRLVRTRIGAGVVRIEGAHWAHVDLEIVATDPLTLEVASAQLTKVQLRATGPVTLRVLEPVLARDLVFSTDSPSAKVDVMNADVSVARVGDEKAVFAGTLSITRSKIAKVNVTAHDLMLESVGLTEARITAENLHWVDVTARYTQVSVGLAIISASRLSSVEVLRCDLMSFHRSTLRSYAIPPCAGGPTRVFESNLTLGNLDGQVDVDSSQIKNSVFGVSDSTDLQLWDTNLSSVNFCAGTDHVVIAGKGSYECATCRELDGSRVPIDACLQADITPLFLKCCPVLDEAPNCDPAPIRMRPPFN